MKTNSILSSKFISLLFILSALSLSELSQAQDGQDDKDDQDKEYTFKEMANDIKESRKNPSNKATRRSNKHAGKTLLDAIEKKETSGDLLGEDDMPLAPPSFPKNTLAFMRQYPNLSTILTGDDACKKDYSPFENITAHGTAEDKGGLANFLNIFIEGLVRSRFVGSLKYSKEFSGINYMLAGKFGPFYTIVDDVAAMKDPGDPIQNGLIPEKYHLVYLVPDDKEIVAKIARVLDLAEKNLVITQAERARIDGKILTYGQFLSLFPDLSQVYSNKDLIERLKKKG